MAPPSHASLSPERRAQLVKERALALGFARAGITALTPPPHGEALERWLADGMAGTMHYMHRQARLRLEPAKILPGAGRAVVVSRNYYTEDPPMAPGHGRVARYARGRDYHNALAAPLAELTEYLRALGPAGTQARPYCDAGPVPERELAQQAGLGWIGKNTMLIDPRRGSYFFIAVILTDVDITPDPPFEADRCGSCRRCLDACPTAAFPEPHVLDSRRCISYATIEQRGPVDARLGAALEGWIFGCDICQEVCPWNLKFARPHDDPALAFDPALAQLDLVELCRISDAAFASRYGSTALARPGPAGMRRNARLALEGAAEPCQTTRPR